MATAGTEHEASLTNDWAKSVDLLSPEEVRARQELVRRIVHSATFARSPRLGSLLSHICELSLNGQGAELNEHSIGHAVFGRSRDYDSAVDGIVRSQASRLRQRLQMYFTAEGANERICVTIPRGRYAPVFTTLPTDSACDLLAPAADNNVVSTKSASPPMKPVSWASLNPAHLLPWALSAMLGILLLMLWSYDRKSSSRPAVHNLATHPLWSRLFTPGRPTMVVAPDSGLVLYHSLSGQDLDLKSYLGAGYRSESATPVQIGPNASRKDSLTDLANRRYTSIVDVQTILELKDRAQAYNCDISMRYARDLRPNDFKTRNVILLGASEADPWVELYEHNLNFLFQDDFKGIFVIGNRIPKPGEPARWESRLDDPNRRVFGVVAFLPSLSGDGSALLLEGTGMSGAEAGMDFVLDDSKLLPFLKRIRQSDGTVPYFELLLETQNIGASATQSKIVAWRTVN